jgi:hypothetical protein
LVPHCRHDFSESCALFAAMDAKDTFEDISRHGG